LRRHGIEPARQRAAGTSRSYNAHHAPHPRAVETMILLAIPAIAIIALVLVDVFEVVILPRTLRHRFRPARLLYRSFWRIWIFGKARSHDDATQETLLGLFGPLALLMLLISWAFALVVGFALLQYSFGSETSVAHGSSGFWSDLYLSGTTFFTLGLGDIAPRSVAAKTTTVIEAGMGFGFLALVIGYLPVFYQSFSRRESNISLLDARAGSPPAAGALLRRYASDKESLEQLLREWERWCADLPESHLSYPVLAWFRSQHEHQSWVAALTAILDVSAVVCVYGDGRLAAAAEMTFAMARHAAVDLSQLFVSDVRPTEVDRLTDEDFHAIRSLCTPLGAGEEVTRQHELASLRATYEPFVAALGAYLHMPLPPWVPTGHALADWETSPVVTAHGGADTVRGRR
jgi:ABC-type multidrug transport system fused ATPase/permease subunit